MANRLLLSGLALIALQACRTEPVDDSAGPLDSGDPAVEDSGYQAPETSDECTPESPVLSDEAVNTCSDGVMIGVDYLAHVLREGVAAGYNAPAGSSFGVEGTYTTGIMDADDARNLTQVVLYDAQGATVATQCYFSTDLVDCTQALVVDEGDNAYGVDQRVTTLRTTWTDDYKGVAVDTTLAAYVAQDAAELADAMSTTPELAYITGADECFVVQAGECFQAPSDQLYGSIQMAHDLTTAGPMLQDAFTAKQE